MNAKINLFIVGGLGCIAPNIIKYASHVMAGGSIPSNLFGLVLGGALFFALAGFLVAYIMDAKDIKDAFYKGVAVPALIISLANGVTSDKNKSPEVPTIPVQTGANTVPLNDNNYFMSLWSPSSAFAQASGDGSSEQGTVEFDISPKEIRNITVRIMDENGNIIAKASSETPAFKISFSPGNYIAAIETAEYYKETPFRITGSSTTKVPVVLEAKSVGMKFMGGVKSLLSR
jgi:hypothetical protein